VKNVVDFAWKFYLVFVSRNHTSLLLVVFLQLPVADPHVQLS